MNRGFQLGLVLLASTAAAMAPAPAAERVVLEDGYAATVNEKVITVGDVLRASMPLDRKIALAFQGAELKEKLQDSYLRTLQMLVEREMILAEARRRELSLPDRAVDTQINSIVRERFDDNRAAFLQALSEQGMSYVDYREQTADDLRVMLLRRQEVIDRIVVAPKAVRDFYDEHLDRYRRPEEVHLRMILLNKGETDADAAAKRRQAMDARARIQRGETFADVARALSEGPKAVDGGDLGWTKTAELRKDFAAAIQSMKPGEVSALIEGDRDFILLGLEARRAESVQPFEEVRAGIEKELEEGEAERLRNEWMSGLRVRHYVRMLQPRRPEL